MYCKHCGTQLDSDARFCTGCGAPVEAASPKMRQPVRSRSGGEAFRQYGDPREGRGGARRKSPVRAGFQARLFGIPISGKAAIVILIILVIVCVILNRRGG
jgi:uncharacterized membrane protein YvbJ